MPEHGQCEKLPIDGSRNGFFYRAGAGKNGAKFTTIATAIAKQKVAQRRSVLTVRG